MKSHRLPRSSRCLLPAPLESSPRACPSISSARFVLDDLWSLVFDLYSFTTLFFSMNFAYNLYAIFWVFFVIFPWSLISFRSLRPTTTSSPCSGTITARPSPMDTGGQRSKIKRQKTYAKIKDDHAHGASDQASALICLLHQRLEGYTAQTVRENREPHLQIPYHARFRLRGPRHSLRVRSGIPTVYNIYIHM